MEATNRAILRAVLVFVGGGVFMLAFGFFFGMVDYAPGHERTVSPVLKLFVGTLFFPAFFFDPNHSFYGMFLGLVFWSVMAFWLSKWYFERESRRQS